MIDYIYIRSWCALFKLDRAETRRRINYARRTNAPADAVTTRMSPTGVPNSAHHTMGSLAVDAEHNAEAARMLDALTQMGETYALS